MEHRNAYLERAAQNAPATSTDPQAPSVGAELKEIDNLCGAIKTNLELHEQQISPALRPMPPGVGDGAGPTQAAASPLVEALRDIRRKLAVINSYLQSQTHRVEL